MQCSLFLLLCIFLMSESIPCGFLVEEADIIDLEKRYWLLKAQSRTGRFDLETFVPLVSPPIHTSLSEGNETLRITAVCLTALSFRVQVCWLSHVCLLCSIMNSYPVIIVVLNGHAQRSLTCASGFRYSCNLFICSYRYLCRAIL